MVSAERSVLLELGARSAWLPTVSFLYSLALLDRLGVLQDGIPLHAVIATSHSHIIKCWISRCLGPEWLRRWICHQVVVWLTILDIICSF